MKLKDRVAIITGSSRGIGRATAILFGQEGAKVVVNYKSEKTKAEAVAKEIGDNALCIGADVTKEDEVKLLVDETMKAFGRIDILINNVGGIERPGNWKERIESWHKTIDTNLTSAWLMIREVAPIMQKQGGGSMVNVVSTYGMSGAAAVLAYTSAKGGLITMTKSFAKELAPTIRVNAVAPSNINTDMAKDAGEEFMKYARDATPLKRIGTPEEIARPILFLVSDDASYITGEVLIVDGGYSLR